MEKKFYEILFVKCSICKQRMFFDFLMTDKINVVYSCSCGNAISYNLNNSTFNKD